MILVGRDEILCRFAGSIIILHKLYLAITCKKFHPGKAVFLFCTARITLCRDEIFPCNYLSPSSGLFENHSVSKTP